MADVTKLVLQGAQACSLATQVLLIKYGDPHAREARILVAMAEAVLDSWCIKVTELPNAEEAAQPPPEPATLAWPPVDRLGRPLTTTIPDVYRENYYHVHEPHLVESPTDARFGSNILPEHQLVLRSWYWNEEALQWRMKFELGHHVFWLNHCQVKPGNEIPKVIDASTQARSNDP